MLSSLVSQFYESVMKPLREKEKQYIADTRIRGVSLCDHLSLTAGIAVAMLQEIRSRGKNPLDICGLNLSNPDLLRLAQLCGWLHDIGKVHLGATDYRLHVQRGVEWTRAWLAEQGVEEPLASVIVDAVARHHLRDNPRTPLEIVISLADSYASAGDRPELAKAASADELQKAMDRIQRLEQQLFGIDKPIRLLLGDVDAIKTYVYETNRLPEIRAASLLLQDAEDKIEDSFREALAKDCLVYCGGGGFLAILPASEAGQWKRKIEEIYLRRTKIATVTVSCSRPLGYAELARGLPPHDETSVRNLWGEGVGADLLFSHFEALTDDRSKRKGFGELVADLAVRLQREKREKPVTPFFPALPVHERCQSCGKRPAVERDTEVTPPEWLCAVCRDKRKVGRERRSDLLNCFGEYLRKHHEIELRAQLPKDLDRLAGTKGRLAFLYADGNNAGDLLQKARTPAQFRHISDALSKAAKTALFKALTETIGKSQLIGTEPLPFEIIALGGDDVIVIVRARYGWALTVRLLRNFLQHTGIERVRSELGTELTMSAGLVIADVKYPVRLLHSLAESLLKKAKWLAREKKQSTLCHLWLRTPVASEDANAILKELYYRNARQSRWLTARPFTLEEAERLTRLAKELRDLPASQRRILAEGIEKGVHSSVNLALYQVQKQQKEKRTQMLEVFKQLGELGCSASWDERFFFWWLKNGEWYTALLDALELVELGEKGGESYAL